MKILALDVGSSSVKAAVLKTGRVIGSVVHAPFKTRFEGVCVEVDARDILRAVATAIKAIGPAAKTVELIALANMSPSWVAMDKHGNAITPIVTHQDRRSVDIALDLEKRAGKARHLAINGNRPVPGGISSTTWAWFGRHAPAVMKKADLCGHVQTLLHRQMTASRVVDPSNASFMGLYATMSQTGWSDELVAAAGVRQHQLPQILGADEIAGLITRDAARRFALTHGTPMLTGCMDGSAAMLLAGAKPGQVVNVCGSTDVLAVCTNRPTPHENLITRALGKDGLWLSVSTVASSGSSITWARENLFPDLSASQYAKLLAKLAAAPPQTSARFEPYLAGDRMSLEQRQGAFSGLTLSTTRQQMLAAIIESLARVSAERLPLLQKCGGVKLRRKVCLTGGVNDIGLEKILHRDWPGQWDFYREDQATLRGLALLPTV